MRVRVAREQGELADQAIAALLQVEPYLAYANFQPIARRPGAVSELHRRRLCAAADALGLLVARDGDGRPLAALALEHRAFDSDHFARPMANLNTPVAMPEEGIRRVALQELYRQAVEWLRARGYQHLSANCSTHDRVACWGLQELDAFYVGTKVSWMQSLTGSPPKQRLPEPYWIELRDRATLPLLPTSSWQRLYRWSGEAFDRGPFVFDLTIPRERALALYQVWTERALTGDSGDVLLVVRDGDGEVVAFHSMMRVPDLSEAAGAGVLGRGIGGTLPEYRGMFTALQAECAAVRPLGAQFLENETQASTVASIHVFGKLGHQCIRSIATFHKRLDDGLGRRSGSGAAAAGYVE